MSINARAHRPKTLIHTHTNTHTRTPSTYHEVLWTADAQTVAGWLCSLEASHGVGQRVLWQTSAAACEASEGHLQDWPWKHLAPHLCYVHLIHWGRHRIRMVRSWGAAKDRRGGQCGSERVRKQT